MNTKPRPQSKAAKSLPPADIITVCEITASITLPQSEIRDFYREAHEIAAKPYGTPWKRNPEFQTLVVGSWDLEWIMKRRFNQRLNKSAPSPKGILAGIRKRMKQEPCEQITVRITGELWAMIMTVAAHYGITPEDHCRCCFGYHAALWRSTSKLSVVSPDPASTAEVGAQILPFHPHRAKRRLDIPAIG